MCSEGYTSQNIDIAILRGGSSEPLIASFGDKQIGTPSISVIIPVYNVEKYLKQCLDSIVNQSLKDIEIICIDDASTDGSFDILKEYASKDARIVLLNNSENLGLGRTRNRGLAAAKGKYIHFLDSDDWLEPETYSSLFKIIEGNSPDFLSFTLKDFLEPSGEYVLQNKYDDDVCEKIISPKSELRLFNFNESAAIRLYKREFLDKNHILFKDMRYEDTPFYIKCLLKAERVMFVNCPFYNYQFRSGSIMNTKWDNFYAYIKWFYVMKAIAKNCSDENIRNVVYKRAKNTILVRYIEFVREKPLKAFWYYTKIQRLIKKEKVFNYSKSAQGSLLYLILKSIGKQYFPSMFNCYINIKKILKI